VFTQIFPKVPEANVNGKAPHVAAQVPEQLAGDSAHAAFIGKRFNPLAQV
jgi:hypothetical protein